MNRSDIDTEIDCQIPFLKGVHTLEDDARYVKVSYGELRKFAKHFAEYGKREARDQAIDYIKEHRCDILIYDRNQWGGANFNLDKTIEKFREAMNH